jgi:hypothetical protein
MRPKRCIWCKQDQDVCLEGQYADLGRRPFVIWQVGYTLVGWGRVVNLRVLGGRRRARRRLAQMEAQ